MATTTLYTPWFLAEFDSGVATVAPILSTGTAVDNSLVAAVQTSAQSNLGYMLATTAGGAPSPVPTPFAVPTWAANIQYGAGQGVMSPTGTLLVRITAGVSRSTFDATEVALWTQDGSAAYAPLVEAVNTVATGGAAQTIPDPSVQSESLITLTANITLTAPTPAAGKSFSVDTVQNGTGGWTITWATPSGAIRWPGGASPTYTTAANARDTTVMVCRDGVNWEGAALYDVR